MKLFDILHEDDGLLVINKPAGLVCHPTKGDEYSSLISRVRLHLGCAVSASPVKRDQPNESAGTAELGRDGAARRPRRVSPVAMRSRTSQRNVPTRSGFTGTAEGRSEGEPSLNPTPIPLPQLVNRLDRETSGLVFVAKDVVVARELRRIWENRDVKKEYWAIVHGHMTAGQGTIEAPLGRDESSIVAVKDCVRPDGAAARTDFVIERLLTNAHGKFTWLKVFPHTGRKHQIRIHLAHYGHPIVGDKLYGGDEDLYMALVQDRLTPEQWQRLILPHQALHAREVQFTWRGQEHIFRAEAEEWFKEFVDAGNQIHGAGS